jgi:outer membrane protein OmpA-like peptidoglycan-associated protein
VLSVVSVLLPEVRTESRAAVVNGTQGDEDATGGEANAHPQLLRGDATENSRKDTGAEHLECSHLRHGAGLQLLHFGYHRYESRTRVWRAQCSVPASVFWHLNALRPRVAQRKSVTWQSVGSAGGTSDRLLLGTGLLALGVLSWLCVLGHATALASALAPPEVSWQSLPATLHPPIEAPAELPVPTPPAPPAPLRVQAELDRLLSSGRIEFETGSDRLQPDAAPLLDAIVALLASEPELEVEVEGHTHIRGDPASNRRLSLRRAQAVQAYLAAQGISPARVHTVGSGSTRPLLRARTPEALEMNRRLEFRVLAPGGR